MRPPVMLAALLLLVLGTAAASPAESDTRPSVPSPTTTPRTVRSRAPVRTTTKDPGPDPRNPYKYYARKQEKLVKTLMKTITEHVTPQFLGDISQLNLTGDCTYGLFKMIFGVKQLKPWAIKMLDASGKMPEGLFFGSLTAFGDMGECLQVRAINRRLNGKLEEYFQGQYCALDIRFKLPPKPARYSPKTFLKNLTDQIPLYKHLLGDVSVGYFYFTPIRMALCVPSTCSQSDIQTLGSAVGDLAQLDVSVPFCEKLQPTQYTTLQLISMAILAFFFCLVLLGTFMDVAPRVLHSWVSHGDVTSYAEKDSETNRNVVLDVLLSFSAFTNGKRLLSTRTAIGVLEPLHGMRVITMAWIILGHTFFYKSYVLSGGLFEALEYGKSFPFQIVLNVFPAVETFVTMSGILVAYNSLRKLEKCQGSFNPFSYFLHRYLRLTPAFLLVSLLMILLPLTGSGPVWNETLQPFAKACEKRWWTNILYIGSWFKREEMCLPHGWYLSCDMHYYIIAPIIFILMFKRPSVSFTLLALLGVGSIASVGVLTYIWQFPPIPIFVDPDPDHFNEFMSFIGYRPYTHLTAFCIGMATGYFLYKNKTLHINRVARLLGWLAAALVNMTVVFGVYNWNAYEAPSLSVAVAYAALSRTAWALGIAWMVVACATGNGGFINKVLSWRAFVPLSRLTYLVYLVHPLLILWHTAYLKKPFYTTQFFVGYVYLGHLFSAYCLSFSLSLTFESPFILLERILLGKPIRQNGYHIEHEKSDKILARDFSKSADAHTTKSFENGTSSCGV
ncbi:nose resistant to fluoxetine protein 6-like [Amblyomma americanum]